jgi:hypothetical protein
MYVPWLPIWVQEDDDDNFSSEFSMNEKSSKNRDFHLNWDSSSPLRRSASRQDRNIKKNMIRKWKSRIEINCKTTMVLNRILYGMPIKRENYICKMKNRRIKNRKRLIKKCIYYRLIKI